MLCEELAAILLRTPKATVQAVIPNGAFENATETFEITSVLPSFVPAIREKYTGEPAGAGAVLLGGEDIPVENEDEDDNE